MTPISSSTWCLAALSGSVTGTVRSIESLEKLSLEDTALREITERKITFAIATAEELALPPPTRIVARPDVFRGKMSSQRALL